VAKFEQLRDELNQVLIFNGLTVYADSNGSGPD